MTHVRLLRQGQGVAGVPEFQSGVHLLRGQDHSTSASLCDWRDGVLRAQDGESAYLGGRLWARRAGDPQDGEGTTLYWPGKTCGVRSPGQYETPLSHAEVAHGVNAGVFVC